MVKPEQKRGEDSPYSLAPMLQTDQPRASPDLFPVDEIYKAIFVDSHWISEKDEFSLPKKILPILASANTHLETQGTT